MLATPGARRRALAVGAALTALLLLTPGCGVMTLRFLDQEVRIDSLPQGARIFVDGRPIDALTPARVDLSRNDSHTIWVEKDGYETPPNQLLLSEEQGWIVFVDVAWMFVLVGFVFLLVDDSLGADSDLVPGQVHFELRPLSWLPAPSRVGPPTGPREIPHWWEAPGGPLKARAPPVDLVG